MSDMSGMSLTVLYNKSLVSYFYKFRCIVFGHIKEINQSIDQCFSGRQNFNRKLLPH